MEQFRKKMSCDEKLKNDLIHSNSEEMIYKLHYPATERDCENIKGITKQEGEMRRLDDEKIEKVLKSCASIQHRFILRKLKLKCHYKQRMQKAEIRRKKFINRLKNIYEFDIEHLKKDVADEIITGIKKVEKERRIREKKCLEGMMTMISRLLEEQKMKRKGIPWPVCKRTSEIKDSKPMKIKKESYFEIPDESIWTGEFYEEESDIFVDEQSGEDILLKEESFKKGEILPKEGEVMLKEQEIQKHTEFLPQAIEKIKVKSTVIPDPVCLSTIRPKVLGENLMATSFITDLEEASVLAQQKMKVIKSAMETPEKSLKATPEIIFFKNFETEKSHDQEFKITNIGTDCLQCRFLNIEYEETYDDSIPLKVLILNRPLLRPGLSFTIKITLYTTCLTEIKGTLLFQTKRKKLKENKTFFRVPFVCTPASAVVNVTPTKIIFPALPWCCAIGPKKSKKVLRVKNLGGRKCVFSIVENTSCLEPEDEECLEEAEKEDEEEGEGRKEEEEEEEEAVKEKGSPSVTESNTPEAIIEELLNNVFAAFRFSKKYYIELKPYSSKQIEIVFSPQYKGLHCELYNLQFENCSNCTEQTVMISGDIERMPLRAEPIVIDLKTCIMDSGVYQGVFKIFNESSKTFPVIAKIPKSMKNFCHVFPSEPIVQSSNFCLFSIKFYPSSSLPEEAQIYYSPDTQVLEFPILIRPNTSYSCKSLPSCKPDYLKIYVLAIITDYNLELNPARIDFGNVTTLETVRKEISLTNHSLSVQEHGFLNLPKGVRVEPNMGFGRIFPKETIPLFVLYSPVLEHIEGNDAGLQGAEGRHHFSICVTSIAELGRFKSLEETTTQISERETSFFGEGEEFELRTVYDKSSANTGESKPEEQLVPIKETIEMVPEKVEEDLSLKIQEKEQKIREFLKKDDGMSECSFSNRNRQSNTEKLEPENENEEVILEGENSASAIEYSEKINSIQCSAFVIDPYCELSSTVIQLPATPCSSFSLTKFQIIGENLSTSSKCYCGLIDKMQKNISSRSLQFEFQYDFPQIRIEPRSGYIKIGENIPVCIIFRPEIPRDIILQESKMQKSAKIFEQINEQKEKEVSTTNVTKPVKGNKGKDKKKIKEASTPKFQTIEDVANSSLCKLNDSDIFNTEKSLLQTMEPFHSEIKISCIIKTEDKTRTESHDMIITSPAIKPDFVYLGNSQEIAFGKVPIGTKKTTFIKIQNVIMKRISPSLSILNPFGPFYYPIGKVKIDPEHVWVVPITFTPFEEKNHVEFFEVRSDKTILLMKATGEGIEAKVATVPEFAITRIEAKPEGSAEFKFDLENSCGGNLSIRIVKEFTKASGERRPSASDKTKTSDKSKKKIQNVEATITEEILQEIETSYNEEIENEDLIFRISELNEELLIPSFAKANIKIQFTPPSGEENKSYVTKYKIMLGKWKILKEFLVFGTVTKRK